MAFFHPVSGFLSHWRSIQEKEIDDSTVQTEEYHAHKQWKRDFEEGNDGVIGEVRNYYQQAKDDARLPRNGLHIDIRGLEYKSHPLHSTLTTIPTYLKNQFNFYKRFHDYFFPDHSKEFEILSNINFTINEGSMTLVIGSPSSGKSSLCKVLANQYIDGGLSGRISFGGQEIRKVDHSHRVAYVRDVDTHYAHLTVQETFEFADALLTPNSSAAERKKKVELIMKILGLSHRANTIVGDDLTRGVSGGERRRVTIGVELLKSCQLLVMDEATTGLDSSTSLQIFRVLRIFADEVAPVFATLKQPGRELFELFDNIIVMHEGRVVYSGPRETMLDYFEEKGFSVNRVPNPADEVLTLVEQQGSKLSEPSSPTFLSSRLVPISFDAANPEGVQIQYKRFSQNWFVQFYWGVKRGFQLMKNNPSIAVSRVVFSIIMALIIGSVFFQLGDHQSAIFGIQGALFIVATFPAFQALSSLPTVFATRPVFYYQRNNNYYHAVPMQFADFVVSLPITIIESVVFAVICYWMIGFNSLFYRFIYLVLMVLCIEVFFSLITKISGFILPTFLLANILVPPTIFMQSFFSGYGIRPDRAPEYLQWVFYVSPFRYLYEGLCINEFLGSKFTCDNDELKPPNNDPDLDLPFIRGGYEGNQICPIVRGEQVLRQQDFEEDYVYVWYWFLVLLGFILVAFIVMIIASYCEFKEKSPRNLHIVEEKHIHHNDKVTHWKDSVRKISQPDLVDDDIPLSGTSSVDSFGKMLEVHAEGSRIDTHSHVSLEWKNLSYTVKILPRSGIFSVIGNLPIIRNYALNDLKLLNDVSGYVKPGMIIAFMGPSGAGKTTLLDVLAQRKTAGKIDGEILVNGSPIDPRVLPHFAGYVEQNNIHMETETVEEALSMSAALRLCYPKNKKKRISRAARVEHVLWVMNILSLTPLRDALISELSLEQKKRVTIGVELAANPSLLWLDEPTSGLDAMAASQVMKAVKKIAESGVAAVCTLHQPSELLFSWCTHLLLLAPGGNVAFFGETADVCHEAKEHFSQFGFYPEEGQNAADFFLDCCTSKDTNPKGQSIIEAYRDSDLYRDVQKTLSETTAANHQNANPWYHKLFFWHSEETENVDDLQFSQNCVRSVFVQWIYVVSRNVRMWWRRPRPFFAMILNAIVYGIVLGLLFSNLDNSQIGAEETPALLYFLNLVLSKIVMTFIPEIFEQRAMFYRETASKAYGKIVYLFSLVMITCFSLALLGIPMVVLTWTLAGLQSDWYRIGYLLGMGCLTPMVAYGLALFLSCSVAAPELANGLFSIVNLVNSFINGYVLLQDDIPSYWIWAYWIGFQHYSLEGIILNELQGEVFNCDNNEGALKIPVPSYSDPSRVRYYCPIKTGEDMMEKLTLNSGWLLPDILILVALISAFFLLSAIIIMKVKHINR